MLSEPTLFRKYYERGDLPVAVSFNGALRKVYFLIITAYLENGARAFGLSSPPSYFLLGNSWNRRTPQIPGSSRNRRTHRKKPKQTPTCPTPTDHPNKKLIDNFMLRSPFNKESWSYVHCFEENSENSSSIGDDRRSFGPILQADSPNLQYVQE